METLTKHGFKFRQYAMYIGVVAWTLDAPLMKHYYGLMPAVFWGIVGIWSAIIMLGQRRLRQLFSIKVLLKLLIITDIIYISVMFVLLILHNVKFMLIFESLFGAYYTLMIFAFTNKATNLYLSKFSSRVQEEIRTTIDQYKIKMGLFGLSAATVLSYLTNVYVAVAIKLIMLCGIVYFEIRILKSEVK